MARSEGRTRLEALPPALGGALTVHNAPEAKAWLSAALAPGGRVQLDLSGVADADLTGLQLLCAAHRWASEREAELLVAPLPPALLEAARRGGFARQKGCRDGCLWLEGGP